AAIVPQASLLLVTSDYESFCLAALEALACGVPVLATRVGGLPEVVTHGVNGFLLPPDDPAAFARHGAALLSNEARRQRMGRAAIRGAYRFAAAHIIPRYEALYADLVHPTARPVVSLPAFLPVGGQSAPVGGL